MEPFKNIYNKNSVAKLASAIRLSSVEFDERSFLEQVTSQIDSLEMKDRVRLISQALHENLSSSPKKNIQILVQALQSEKNPNGLEGFLVWPLTQYVESYGLDDFNSSLLALKEMTKRFTSEFAIRPFLKRDCEKVFKKFYQWRSDPCEHVRRWVSEGTRPHLPWGEKVEQLTLNPERSVDLIAPLAYDESEYVRKSVANHLNDISHFNASLCLKSLKQIDSKHKDQKRLIKRASRTLLKKSDKRAFRLNGYSVSGEFDVLHFKTTPKKIREGESLVFEVKLQSTSQRSQKIQLSVRMSFPRANGKSSDKIFQLKDFELAPEEKVIISKKHHFKKVTTRKHYPGLYELAVRVNGVEVKKNSFQLVD